MSTIENTLSKAPELVMNERSLNALLDETWQLRDASQPIVPFLRGAPGIGKTQLVYAWGRTMQEKYPDFRVCDFMLADKYPSDLVAQIPDHTNKTLNGYINEVLEWSVDPEARGIIFFDEITQAMQDTVKVVSKVVNERKFGQFTLSPDVIVVLAGNRATDKAGASKLFSMMANRVDTYDCVPDTEAIVDYMIDKGYNPILPAYMAAAPYQEARDFQPNDSSFYSHRSMERVAQRWTHRDPAGDKGVVMGLMDVAASIGIGRAREFVSFVEMIDKMPSRKEIKSDPNGCKVPSKLDEQCAVTCMLTVSADKDTFKSYSIYMQRFPISMQILFLKLCLKRNGEEIKRVPEFTQWVIKPEVKAAIMDRTL